MVIKFIILLFMSFCFTQETHTFTADEVDNIFSHIQELEIKDSLNTNYIKLLEEKSKEDSLLLVDYKLKVDN